MRFPGFTDEWKKVTLGEIGTGFNYGLNAPAKEYDGMNKYIRITDIEESTGAYSEADVVSPNGKLSDEYIVNDNDILLARTGASTGKSYLYAPKDGRLYFAGFLIRFNVNKANPYFIYTNLHTRNYWRWVNIMSARSGQPGINSQEYSSYQLYIPSRKEQNKIANLLQLLDERISTQNKIIEDLKKLKSAISDLFFEGHYVSDNSIGWKTVTLGDITENFHHRNKNSDSYPMYSVTNTSGFSPQHEVFEGKEIKDEDISIYKIIHKGEFAYNPARINVGSIGRYDEEEPCMISSLYVCFRPTAQVDSDWLLYYLQSAKKIYQYGIFGEGGVRIYLFYPNFSRIEALLPPLTVQKEIASILKSFNRKIKLEELLLSNYQKQKKFLLAQMFT